MTTNIFTTTEGLQIHLKPISQDFLNKIEKSVVNKFKAAGEPISPPTYEVQTAGGGVETHTHDETTIETEEEKSAWEAYKDATRRMKSEINSKQTSYLMNEGFDIQLPEDNAWISKQKMYGIDESVIPSIDNVLELKEYWLTTEVLKTPSDVQNAMKQLIMLSFDGVPQEVLDQIEESFRSFMSYKVPQNPS